jgi:hypothetical protein
MIKPIDKNDDNPPFPFPCPGYIPIRESSQSKRYTSFLATRMGDHQTVLLDFIRTEYTPPANELADMKSRVQKVLGLQHPGIVRLSNLEYVDGRCILVHEEVPMTPLSVYIREHGCPGDEAAVEIIRQLADALAYAWKRKSLTHQDLDAHHIMMDEHQHPRIRDLGITELFQGTTSLGRIDIRNDMYGLAKVFDVLMNAKTEFPSTEVPVHVMDIIRRMGAEELHRRPTTWEEVCARLRAPEGALQRKNEPSKAWQPTRYKPQKGILAVKTTRGKIVLAATIILSLLLAAGILLAANYKTQRLARSQLSKAIGFKADAPDKHNDLIDQLNRILELDLKEPLRQKVAEELASAEAARAAVLRQILSKLDAQAARHIERKDYGAAAHAYHSYSGPHQVESQSHRESRIRLIERMTSTSVTGVVINPDQDPRQVLMDVLGVNTEKTANLEKTMCLQLAQRALAWQRQYEGLLRFLGSTSTYNPDMVTKTERDLKAFLQQGDVPDRRSDHPPLINSVHEWGEAKQSLSAYYSKNRPD